MAKKKTTKKRRFSRARRVGHTIRHSPRSLLAVVTGLGAVAIPFVKPAPTGTSVMGSVAKIASGDIGEINWIGVNFVEALEQNWLEMIGLGIAAAGTAYFGKKLGGTKATRINNKWSAV